MERSHRELVSRYSDELRNLDHDQSGDVTTGQRLGVLERYVEELHGEMDTLMSVLDEVMVGCNNGSSLVESNTCTQFLKAKQIRAELARVYKQHMLDIDLTADSGKHTKAQLLEQYVNDLNEQMETLLPLLKENTTKIKSLTFPLRLHNGGSDSLSQFRWLKEDVERERGAEFTTRRISSPGEVREETESEKLAKKYESINRLHYQIEQLVERNERFSKEINELRSHNEELEQSVAHASEELSQLRKVIQRHKESELEYNGQIESLRAVVAEQRSDLLARKSSIIDAVDELVALRLKLDKLKTAEDAVAGLETKNKKMSSVVDDLRAQLSEYASNALVHKQDFAKTTQQIDSKFNLVSYQLDSMNEAGSNINTSMKTLEELIVKLKVELDKYNKDMFCAKEATLDILSKTGEALQYKKDLEDVCVHIRSAVKDINHLVSDLHGELGRYRDMAATQERVMFKMGEELHFVKAKLYEAETKKKHYKEELYIVSAECHEMYLQLERSQKNVDYL